MINIPFTLDDGAYPPERAYTADAGFDLRSREMMIIPPRGSAVINTGVHMAIPEGYVGFLKSKSGLNVNHDVTGTGVIDSGYTGPIQVKLYNHHNLHSYKINVGDKVSQIVILPIPEVNFYPVEELSKTERGGAGFGSTGR